MMKCLKCGKYIQEGTPLKEEDVVLGVICYDCNRAALGD